MHVNDVMSIYYNYKKQFWHKKKIITVDIELALMDSEYRCATTTVHCKCTWLWRNVVYITNCIWAAVYKNVAEDSARSRLYPGIQSELDGKRQRL